MKKDNVHIKTLRKIAVAETDEAVTTYETGDFVYGLTTTCYVDLRRKTVVYVSRDRQKTEKKLAKKLWLYIEVLMQSPNAPVNVNTILNHLYPDEVFIDAKNSRYRLDNIKGRLCDALREIGVTDEELDHLIEVGCGKNTIQLNPTKPVSTSLHTVLELINESGMSEAQLANVLSYMMYQGVCGRMGREMLVSLAKDGNGWAAFEIGELYFHGYITQNHLPNYEKACEWYKKAGDHPGALWSLGYAMMKNYWPHMNDPADIDYGTALQYLEKANKMLRVKGGSPAALTSIGQLWEEGHYPARDYTTENRHFEPQSFNKAKQYYEQADAMGYHYATNRLALYHEKKFMSMLTSNNLDNRAVKAFECYKRSSELVGDGYIYNKLGQLLEKGIGCKRNVDEACVYYMKSVDGVLEDDMTGWGTFNAARVCANRISGQSLAFVNYPRALDLFRSALQMLPVEKRAVVLTEMINVLLDNAAQIPVDIAQRWKLITVDDTERFLKNYEKMIDISDARTLKNRLELL